MFDVSVFIARIEDLTRKIENQNRQIEDQNRQIEDQNRKIADLNVKTEKIEDLTRKVENQNRQIKDLTQELNLAKTTLHANVLIQDKNTQSFIALTNNLIESIHQHDGLKSLTWLFAFLVKDLRKYCEDNIPMASATYLPHHQYKSSLESMHEGSHLAEHVVHEFTRVAVQYLPSLKDVLRVTGLVMHQVPILGFALAVLDIISTHQAIHKAKHSVGLLRNFSQDLRNVLYHYVIAWTMLSLATRITTNTLIYHSVAQEHPLSFAKEHALSEKLLQWYALLLAESISSLKELSSLKKPPEDIPNLQDLATHWCESIAKKFLQPGAYMRNLLQINEGIQYRLDEVGVALKIQGIFTEPNSNSSHSYLATPLEGPFLDPFHAKLYNEVLEPYRKYGNAGSFAALFTGYLWVLEKLQEWLSRYTHALYAVEKELLPGSLNFELQLCLINTCLFGNLEKMCSDMPWHKRANQLFMEMSRENLFECLRNPLRVVLGSNELVMITSKALLVVANARADRAEEGLDLANKERDQANKERDQTKEELDQTKEKLDQTKEKLDQTKEKLDQTKEKLDQTKEELDQTKEELDQTKEELDQTKEELKKANTSFDKYEARAEKEHSQTQQKLNQAEQEITNLKAKLKKANDRIKPRPGVSTSQRSSLLENSLFKTSSGGGIIESNKAGCSNNSTLQ